MNIRQKSISSIAAAALLLLAGCSGRIDPQVAEDELTVNFAVGLDGCTEENSSGTKAEVASSIASFKVAAYNNEGIDHAKFIDPAVEVSVNSGKGTTNIRWTKPYAKRFYAYANLPAAGAASVTASYEGQTLTYTLPETAEAQTDILLAAEATEGGSERTAALIFKHPLASVSFKLGSMQEVTAISEISLTGVYAGGTVTQKPDGTFGSWTPAGEPATTRTVKQTIGSFPSAGTAIGIPFMLIPQSGNIAISIKATVKGTEKALTGTLTGVSWTAGQATAYTVDYVDKEGLNFTGNAVEWGTADGISAGVEDHIYCGHEYVEIEGTDGKVLKWATMNIGATTVTGTTSYGDLYSWGDVETKSNYGYDYYIAPAKNINTDITPESGFDVARVKWGGTWRMPTEEEYTNMRNATYWAWADSGYYVFAPDASHSAGGRSSSFDGTLNKSDALLFLPAAGYSNGPSKTGVGSSGYYWTSNINDESDYYAVDFYSSYSYYGYRYYGYSVRPVSD